ncbi:hypothetical protein XM25_10795 [Devosia sp. H5989]|nr:hypothetical protein XM25_10795 [Devosia sp. H5989]
MTFDLTRTTPSGTIVSALRSVGAVAAGFLAIAALSTVADIAAHNAGLFPADGSPSYDNAAFLVAFGYRTAFGILAGYIVARLAPHHPMGHALALGVIGLVLGALGAVSMWGMGPAWYAIAVALVAPPATWLGARLQTSRH